ncbi:heme A synthase [Vibrio variabilis]|uniref:Heme A synthase n=1 Tax=Vibrio variabilis TaxID=990271 RepID=A0ABQ0JH75_9VIBR|nr:heme A synthase [Vibrio variabilis]
MGLMNLVKAALVLTVVVIAMGAYTRLADAGLGCLIGQGATAS